MKVSTSTTLAILATSTAASAVPGRVLDLPERQYSVKGLSKRDDKSLTELAQYINNYKAKREAIDEELMKRDYAIVTDVLTAINQTQLAPKVLDYFVSNPIFQTIIVQVFVAVMKSGVISLEAVLEALTRSNLAVNVINDLISDCSLYVQLFDVAKGVISNLADKVKELISDGVSSLIGRDEEEDPLAAYVIDLEKKVDLDTVVDNLLDSLYKSGLATSVVKDILTNSDYIPFAVQLIVSMLANHLVDVSNILSALKDSGLAVQLFQRLLNFLTLQTVASTAFAAFAGKCQDYQGPTSSSSGTTTASTGGLLTGSSGSSSGSVSSGSDSTSGTGNTGASVAGPCKRRVRRRRRRNY